MYIYIRAMSESQSKVYDAVSSASTQIDMHIMKILFYPTSEYVDHWMHEIWSFLYFVPKLKGSNKFPKASLIKRGLSVYNDMLDSFIEIVQEAESNLVPEYVDVKRIQCCVSAYQDWLSENLSKHGTVKQSDVKSKLSEICNIH